MLPFPVSSVPHEYIYSELENCALCNGSCFAYEVGATHDNSSEKSLPSKIVIEMSKANTLANLLNFKSAWSDHFLYTQKPYNVDWIGPISKLLGRAHAGAYISMPANVYFLEYIVLKKNLNLNIVYNYEYTKCKNIDYLILVKLDNKVMKKKYYLYNSKVLRLIKELSDKTYSLKNNDFSFVLCPVRKDKVKKFRKIYKNIENKKK